MKGLCLQSPKGLNTCCMIYPFVLQGMKGPCLQSPKGLNMCCMIHPFVLQGMKGPCLQSPKGLNTCCMIHPFFLRGMKGPCLQSPKELDQSNVAAQSCYSVRPAVQVQCCFKPTETIRTIRDREPSMPWPLHLSHSSWALSHTVITDVVLYSAVLPAATNAKVLDIRNKINGAF